MRRILALVIALSCAAAAEAVAQQAGECREFTAPAMIAGQQKQATGRACLQPDGSWRIAQEDPLPAQLYLAPPVYVPPPAAYTPVIPYSGGSYLGGGAYSGGGAHYSHGGFWDRWGTNAWNWNRWGWRGRRW